MLYVIKSTYCHQHTTLLGPLWRSDNRDIERAVYGE